MPHNEPRDRAAHPAWPDGPWQDEPDYLVFTTKNGYYACIIRALYAWAGYLCGYIAVAPGHPWYAMRADYVPARVHGGVTYAAFHKPAPAVLLVPDEDAPKEPDDAWWLGFDCAHGGDLLPGEMRWGRFHSQSYDTYRNIAYVRAQCEALAEQAARRQASSQASR